MPATVQQQKISTFFNKPSASPLASKSSNLKRATPDADNDPDAPPPKRSRTSIVESPPPEVSVPSVPSASKGQRTSRYLFSSTIDNGREEHEEDDIVREAKDRLHRQFVKKLGHPDAISEIKRRNRHIEDPVGEADSDVNDEEEEAVKPKKGSTSKKGASKLTPMEKQVLEIKSQHEDTLLVVEVGYKFRFFGEDARTAARELGIVCIPGKFRFDEHPSEAHLDRFASASIPVHRLHVHVKRLVTAGHKVGVVRQLETAALKAVGDNRNAPFTRKLTNLYTKGTYIDDVEGLGDPSAGANGLIPSTGHLLCLTETNSKGWGNDEKVTIGLVAVQPSTGDIIYDDFEDGFMRSEVETRLLHIAPCEILILGTLSHATEKIVHHLAGTQSNVYGDKVRIERSERPIIASAYASLKTFLSQEDGHQQTENDRNALLENVGKLSENINVCLHAMVEHLKEYGLEHVFRLASNYQPFKARSHMILNGNTLASLEIFRNQTDYTERGSLLWVLDQTKTRFGQRLLRKWIGQPLLDSARLQERLDAVQEIKDGENTMKIDKLKHVLSKIRVDLEKCLLRIYYRKSTRPELLNALQALQRLAQEYAAVQSPSDSGFQSQTISNAVAELPKILQQVTQVLEKINGEAAKSDDKYAFFREEYETEEITEHRIGIACVEHDLNDFRKEAADKLRKHKVEFVTVSGIEYLIEIDNSYVKNVPASWAKISGTKKVSRFHAPEVVKLIRERDQHKEALAAACDQAFIELLSSIGSEYESFRSCIQALATLDCLVSLAEVAQRPGYCKPTFTSSTSIAVQAGRHPMVEQLLLDAYVPNNIDLASNGTRALLITGPNGNGKSSYVRQVALIVIMAQIGSYVPASSAELGIFDAVFTRMGAFDNMLSGESTFMVELSETSDILKQATPRSLIVLDELGRGTSTHDGVAIAQAVLDHIVRDTKSLLLFITHYQNLGVVEQSLDGALRNMHMRFTENTQEDESDITFLYELGEGVAHRSYGLHAAKLMNVPKQVVDVAAVKSRELELEIGRTQLAHISGSLATLFKDGWTQSPVDILKLSIDEFSETR